MTKDEEKGYIERVLAGDEIAYEPLVTENQTKVYRLALRILKHEADAEEMCIRDRCHVSPQSSAQ